MGIRTSIIALSIFFIFGCHSINAQTQKTNNEKPKKESWLSIERKKITTRFPVTYYINTHFGAGDIGVMTAVHNIASMDQAELDSQIQMECDRLTDQLINFYNINLQVKNGHIKPRKADRLLQESYKKEDYIIGYASPIPYGTKVYLLLNDLAYEMSKDDTVDPKKIVDSFKNFCYTEIGPAKYDDFVERYIIDY